MNPAISRRERERTFQTRARRRRVETDEFFAQLINFGFPNIGAKKFYASAITARAKFRCRACNSAWSPAIRPSASSRASA